MPRVSEGDEKKMVVEPECSVVSPPLRPFFMHQWLDVCDPQGTWFEAQVKDVKVENHEVAAVFVHYKGFDAQKYDEWLNVQASSPDLERIALLNTYSKPGYAGEVDHLRLSLGLRIDILDSLDQWYSGQVHEIKEIPGSTQRLVRVSYEGCSNQWDEYIYSGSYRLAPLHSKNKPALETKGYGQQTTPQHTQENYNYNNNSTPMKGTHQYKAEPAEERKFRHIMQQKGWKITDQGGDGNCLFRSVSHQMYGTPDYHELVRSKCVEYIISEKLYFASYIPGNFDLYVSEMRKPGTWGDHVEIQAMSEIYDRPIQIYAYSETPLNTYQHGRVHQAPVRLSYHYQSHYNSIVDDASAHKPLLNTRPGEMEDKQLDLSKKRGGRRVGGGGVVDDLQKALAASRVEFQALQRADVDRALYLSVRDEGKGMSDYDRAVLESLKDGKRTPPIGDLEKALQKSREQAELAELEKVKRESEEQMRRREEEETLRAKVLSMEGSAGTSGGFSDLGGFEAGDDSQFNAAIAASLREARGGLGGSEGKIQGLETRDDFGFGFGLDNLDEQRAIAMSLEQFAAQSNMVPRGRGGNGEYHEMQDTQQPHPQS
eukprot:gb/GEZN01000600.1/.p1 GENE.gb/GEZN01000600.1/~~gb/GEZN01000600.1/.p1  ORF type:complete len:598 (-),score=100.62 gb/GEZN01000600.1/:72-1865(-)